MNAWLSRSLSITMYLVKGSEYYTGMQVTKVQLTTDLIVIVIVSNEIRKKK